MDTTAMRAVLNLSKESLAAAGDDIDGATLLLEDAVDGFERCGARFDGARARVELARALLAAGQAGDALREAGVAAAPTRPASA